jgi:4-amino-4-deoxy-L-arabinose transferase-like glycosyltransferase
LAAWILRDYPEQNRWLTRVVLVTGLGSAGALALLRRERPLSAPSRLLPAVALVGLVAILATPAVWAGYTTWHGSNGTLPAAGPDDGFGPFGRVGFGAPRRAAESATVDAGSVLPGARNGPDMATADPKLVAYLEQHRRGETFLFATTSAMTASPYILATGEPVAALGGFAGADPILTADQLAAMIQRREMRYFLVPSAAQQQAMAEQFAKMFAPKQASAAGAATGTIEHSGFAAAGPGIGQSANTEWIDAHCAPVPEQEWKSVADDAFSPMGMNTLFDCANAR